MSIGLVIELNQKELEKEFDNIQTAYDELYKELQYFEAKKITFDFYLISSTDEYLLTVYKIVETLKKIKWFKKSIKTLKIFKIKDYSCFENVIKERK